MLPLGGFGIEGGGHKGYGLGALAEILTGVLAGGGSVRAFTVTDSLTSPSGVTSHFFGAFRIDAMRDLAISSATWTASCARSRTARRSPGQDRVYVAGETEHENEIAFRRDGIPLIAPVIDDLDTLADDLGIARVARVG